MLYFTKFSKASPSASGGAQSPAFRATKEIISGYQNIRPMIQSDPGTMEDMAPSKPSSADVQPIQDVVAAEMKFGISYFKEYHSIAIIGGQRCILFKARLQRHPEKLRIISCPRLIRAPNLTSVDRKLLQIKLDAASGLIPKEEWDKLESRYKIAKKDWFIVLDV